tara:strand:+ start:1487 stop:1699 length:213 start_codon:yes stop_codon:yes gene_type:complete
MKSRDRKSLKSRISFPSSFGRLGKTISSRMGKVKSALRLPTKGGGPSPGGPGPGGPGGPFRPPGGPPGRP